MNRASVSPSLPLTLARHLTTLDSLKSTIFYAFLFRYFLRFTRHLRARGLLTTAHETYLTAAQWGFELAVRWVPSVKNRVKGELDQVTRELQDKLAPSSIRSLTSLTLPAHGLSHSEISSALDALANVPNTKWEEGRVSGAVYNGSEEVGRIWREAFEKFEVSNPLHADVFPGVRAMDSAIVSICLSLFNSPLPVDAVDENGGCGTTTSGGTESILMACKAYRDRARVEYGITEPEMIVPISAHAAFDKAASYFGIKIHHIPVDRETRKVNLKRVKKAINPNTIMLVGSAPNFPDGAIDDISALSSLALSAGGRNGRIGLHVDCCLGSFLVPFLEEAGFETVPFDFRVEGVTSISCDTHKYGFAPKGSSVIMYRSKALRKHAYSVLTSWPGGVYATPTLAGSRPGAVLAGTYASLLHLGHSGYLSSCLSIVGAAKKLVAAIRADFPELYVLGDPLVSVVAFGSRDEKEVGREREGGVGRGRVSIYEVGDHLSRLGWHLNALQHPPALHIACTRLTVPAVEDFLRDLRRAVDEVKGEEGKGTGSMVMLYGLGSSSAVGPGLVGQMASRYIDVMYS
ncbi:hypothetical protein JCM8547_003325 [Rhodosporidiobolus lusitaniae]